MSDSALGASPLLQTKLHAPRPRRQRVSRARLTERFVAGARPVLTLVSAPAGFGKTTLVAEYLSAAQVGEASAAWLSLDAGDNDNTVFGTYLLAALNTAAPGALATAQQALGGGQPLAAIVAALANDLQALANDVTLVLDDYHAIDAPEIHGAITFLVDHAPMHLHLVLATRADPPFPLARWRARGDLLEIRGTDLRFTADETALYLRDAMHLQLTAHDVRSLAERTEGWIAALQLAALSLQGRDDVAAFIDNFAGDDRFVLDYLAEEVLDRQQPEAREFLLLTSVLHRLSGPLCDAVTGTTGGKATLQSLERANLFVVPLDDRRQWYRYHHLFADVVRARLLDERPEAVPALHRRASEWYAAHNETAEALRHALAGHHHERAAQLLELYAPTMSRNRQEATLRRWCEELPDAMYDARPVLTLTYAGARMSTGDPTGVSQLLDRAERWVGWVPQGADGDGPTVHDHEQFAQLPAFIEMYRSGLALLAGDTAATLAHATRVLELAHPTDHLRIGAASALIGLAHWTLGELGEARDRYTDAVHHLRAAGHLSDAVGCSLGLADVLLAQGRPRDARGTYEAALQLADGHSGLRGVADMHVGLAELCTASGDLDTAARHLHTADELGETAGLPQHPYRWRVAQANLCLAQGDAPAALALLDEAARRYNTDFSPPVRPVAAMRARVQLATGDVGGALRWVEERGLTIDDQLDYVREYEHVTLARVLLAQAHGTVRRPALSAFVQRLLVAAEQGGREGTVAELRELVTTGGTARSRSRVRLVEQLSGRELDVLQLLRTELSGPEIARELHVSLNTLRSHTKSIYTKLGATNRREALRLAAEHGL